MGWVCYKNSKGPGNSICSENDLRGYAYNAGGQGFASVEECVDSCDACLDGYGKPTFVKIEQTGDASNTFGIQVKIVASDGTELHKDSSPIIGYNEQFNFDNYCPEDLTICVSTDKKDYQGKAGRDSSFRNEYILHKARVEYTVIVQDALGNIVTSENGGWELATGTGDFGGPCLEKSCAIPNVSQPPIQAGAYHATIGSDNRVQLQEANATAPYVAKWKSNKAKKYFEDHKAAGAISSFGLYNTLEYANLSSDDPRYASSVEYEFDFGPPRGVQTVLGVASTWKRSAAFLVCSGIPGKPGQFQFYDFSPLAVDWGYHNVPVGFNDGVDEEGELIGTIYSQVAYPGPITYTEGSDPYDNPPYVGGNPLSPKLYWDHAPLKAPFPPV